MAKNKFSAVIEIGASLNSAFASAFGSADSRIKQLGDSMKVFRKTENDIRSLVNAQGSLKDSQARHNDELKKLNQLLALAPMKRNAEDTKKYNANVEAQRKVVQQTGRAVKDERRAIDELGASLRRAGVDTKNIEKAQKKLGMQMEETRRKAKMLDSIKGLNLGTIGNRLLPALMMKFPAFGKVMQSMAPSLIENLPLLGALVGLISIVVAGIVALGTGLFMLAKRFSDNTQNLKDTSAGLGTTVEGLSALQLAGRNVGIETEKMTTYLNKFQVSLQEAVDTSGGARTAFEELGLDATTLQAMDAQEAMNLVADAFKNYQGSVSKSKLGTEIFGKNPARLVGLLNKGSANLNEEAKNALESGYTPDKKMQKQSDEFDAWWEGFTASWDGFMNKLGSFVLWLFGFKGEESKNIYRSPEMKAQPWHRDWSGFKTTTNSFTDAEKWNKERNDWQLKLDREWLKQHPGDPSILPEEGNPGSPMSSINNNRNQNITINISTQPGSDQTAIANAVARIFNRQSMQASNDSLYDTGLVYG
jgi:hypothetical protein